jgi:hypothetical protein
MKVHKMKQEIEDKFIKQVERIEIKLNEQLIEERKEKKVIEMRN